jgi:hypothetical protein
MSGTYLVSHVECAALSDIVLPVIGEGWSKVLKGIDASMNATVYAANLRTQGVTFIGRYYTNLAATRRPEKALTPREAHDLSQAGFSLVAVWELLATPGYFNGNQGFADGQYAYKYALEMIRQPEDSAIYFAVDFDASQIVFEQAVVPYFRGVAEAFASASGNRPLYSVGVYGSGAVCAALKQNGLARYSWMSQSMGWQGSRTYQDWDIRQGPTVGDPAFQFDEDIAKDEFGAFRVSFENTAPLFAINTEMADAEHKLSVTEGDSRQERFSDFRYISAF